MRTLIVGLVVAIAASACTYGSECGEGSGELAIEVEAAPLARPGSRLQMCIGDDCNPEDRASTYVSVNYGTSGHPLTVSWSVLRQTESSWEGLAGGTLDLECKSERSMIRVEVDADGNATVTRTP